MRQDDFDASYLAEMVEEVPVLGSRSLGRVRQGVCLLLLASYTNACTGWVVQTAPPQQVVTERHPDQARITRVDGSEIVLHRPVVSGDSLLGAVIVGKNTAGEDSLQAVGLPAAEARTIAIRKVNAGKTVGLVLGVAAGAFVLAIGVGLIVCGTNDNGCW